MSDVIHLSTDALVKAINDEYAVILTSERTNLQRALAIGEKLVALRPRIAPKHGDWKTKLAEHCPTISYETANLYIRFYSNLDKLKEAAAKKSVTVTDFTIQEARKALTTPSQKTNQPAAVAKGGVVEAGNEPQPRSLPPDQALEGLANDEVFHTLQNVYENRQDELMELTTKLARHFGMTLMPLATTEALMEAIGVPDAPAMS